MTEHVVLAIQTNHIFCTHCGAARSIPSGGVAVSELTSTMSSFYGAHADCPRPEVLHEPPRPDRTPPVAPELLVNWPGLEEWLRHGEIGVSSSTLAASITGLPLASSRGTPLDASDFRRCVGLLQAAPALRDGLIDPITRGRLGEAWRPLLDAWEDLEVLLQHERFDELGQKLRAGRG